MKSASSKRRPVTGQKRRASWLLYLIAAAAVAIVAAAIVRQSTGQSQGAASADSPPIAVPDLALPSTSGQPVSLASYRGYPLIVYFYEGAA